MSVIVVGGKLKTEKKKKTNKKQTKKTEKTVTFGFRFATLPPLVGRPTSAGVGIISFIIWAVESALVHTRFKIGEVTRVPLTTRFFFLRSLLERIRLRATSKDVRRTGQARRNVRYQEHFRGGCSTLNKTYHGGS